MADYIHIFKKVKSATRKLMAADDAVIKETLASLVKITLTEVPFILSENNKDLSLMDIHDPKYDRLKLTEERIKSICGELSQVQNLPSPLDRVLDEKHLSNGLFIKKITVPLGILGVIYEARPNVTFDVFALALKSGNGLILKGGSDADHSNRAIMSLIHRALKENGLPEDAFQLLPPDRLATKALLEAVGYVDVIIPRGSQGLIDFVRQNSKVPVIETGAGIVHTFFDESADLEKGKAIIFNAKTRRPSVCNSLDCLIIHEKRLPDLQELIENLLQHGVKIYADETSFHFLKPHPLIVKANTTHFGTEFLSLQMSIKTVSTLEGALEHISQYSSKHSEAIISEDQKNIAYFLKSVDAAAVYANASTAFTDGNQFGLGAEIGISTQKLHARGPMALNELTSYKWVIKGDGQIRN
ncbi:glutamate-5-semialdehyde dehydrogenase [Aquiflexum gelatinilyticum]|uniref:Gamma-glutamyl phosphate reductase n=1 Tax=Aquiflexum gelatinilyticum TaxID=2961943 RepID=A0A9X2P4P3_9BACT|nr:glutamate-5-semialdehyde dehydrogenase [Aquiflexum gelatinilyticum]MCR9014746.1 glutamate-5-semialdehyde dehydrogenase [Aquiflexum gelatinilyticum]